MTRLTVRPASIAALLGGVAAASIVGSADAQVVLSNMSSYTGSEPTTFIYSGSQRAISFQTGSGSWNLLQVSIKGAQCFTGTMQIWSDNFGPSSVVATSGNSTGGFSFAEVDYAFTGTTLAANTTYWMVFDNGFVMSRSTTIAPTAENSSGWGSVATSLVNTGSGWTNSSDTLFFEIQATTSGGGVPLPGAAGLAACGLLGLSRRRRR